LTDSQIIAALQAQNQAQAQQIILPEEKVMTLLELFQKQSLYNLETPNNNVSERAIRIIKPVRRCG